MSRKHIDTAAELARASTLMKATAEKLRQEAVVSGNKRLTVWAEDLYKRAFEIDFFFMNEEVEIASRR